ncbi:NAD(P)/FAD-dependent oxidoreductase [Actinokineospora bangkokensis]|uniref:NAD/FAD-dependent oxidoreductase n=1 Tax=Actinokineospora bangkokensis TaxID=1193682 RepID=A0A1Q9LJE6_9PSEU|nr:FAD-dependent oxidoreductase [Actinokineospora bangkokensis]OLR92172.1 NAD/FAD-dependent oxidoreductase [Actinokineospora bangkokensis]
MKAIVVGAGISGVSCARALAEAGVDVRVLERGRVVGGRMATKRYGGRPADIGAGYFTARGPGFTPVVASWVERGLAAEWTDTLATFGADGVSESTGQLRYSAPAGLRSLVADLAAGLRVETGHPVARVRPGSVDGEEADVVVLAMPGPQAARLLAEGTRAHEVAAGQRWSPTLVATLVHDERRWDFPGAFVNDHPVLQTLFDDGTRRGDGHPVLVAHSTADHAREHLADPKPDDLARAVSELLGIPAPREAHVHRWTYAIPENPHSGPPFFEDGIGLAGDAWGSPRVETAWQSGVDLAGRVLGR